MNSDMFERYTWVRAPCWVFVPWLGLVLRICQERPPAFEEMKIDLTWVCSNVKT